MLDRDTAGAYSWRMILTHAALKWTAIAIWFDLSDRIIGSLFDMLFAHYPQLAWLDGFTNVVAQVCP
jgi:hypothetical protein